jgi:uncharacterized protein YegL
MLFNKQRKRIHNGHRNQSRRSRWPQSEYAYKLASPDQIGIVGFHDSAFVVARPIVAHDTALQQRSQQLHARIGGTHTNITDALRKSVDLLRNAPPGMLRRIWLLTDGYPNREHHDIMGIVQQAREAHINVNTIGFGDTFDQALLQKIAHATHNGKFVSVQGLRQLSDALVTTAPPRRSAPFYVCRRRPETTIIAVDLSVSMREPMEGRTKILVVEQALMQLLLYKQKCFS